MRRTSLAKWAQFPRTLEQSLPTGHQRCLPPSTLCTGFKERAPIPSPWKNPTQLSAPHPSPRVAVQLVLVFVGTRPNQYFLDAGHLHSSLCRLPTLRSQRMAEQMGGMRASEEAYGRKSPWDLPPCVGWLHILKRTLVQLKRWDVTVLIPSLSLLNSRKGAMLSRKLW